MSVSRGLADVSSDVLTVTRMAAVSFCARGNRDSCRGRAGSGIGGTSVMPGGQRKHSPRPGEHVMWGGLEMAARVNGQDAGVHVSAVNGRSCVNGRACVSTYGEDVDGRCEGAGDVMVHGRGMVHERGMVHWGGMVHGRGMVHKRGMVHERGTVHWGGVRLGIVLGPSR